MLRPSHSQRMHGAFVAFGAFGAFAALVAFGALAVFPRSANAASRLHVRGGGKIELAAVRDNGDLVLSGTLTDDANRPLNAEHVIAIVQRESDPSDAAVADALRTARSCGPGAGAVTASGGALTLATDEGGRFCAKLSVPLDRYRASASWAGTPPLVKGARTEIQLDLSRRSLALAFDPEPRIVSLDLEKVAIEAVAQTMEDGVPRPAAGKALTLSDERGTQLATETTSDSGRVRFVVATSSLGPPGRGELRVRFAGDGDVSFATHSADVERHAHVDLTVPKIPDPSVAEDGVQLLVEVRAHAAGRVPGREISEGSVEARVGNTVVGAAPVEVGRARPVLTFAAPEGGDADVRLRYVSNSPWLEPSADLTVRVPVRGPGPWRRLPLLIAAIAVIAWLLVARTRTARPPEAIARIPPKETNVGRPKIDVIRAARDPRTGWSGRIVDAHEGTPIAGATIAIERPGFTGRAALGTAYADDDGRFTLRAPNANAHDELVAEGPLHSPLRQALPEPSELGIALVLRKRKLLERLVLWAKRRGAPFDMPTEPTPGHVRRAAQDDYRTARWADQVERAAFGPGAVDADRERSIDALMPDAPEAANAANVGAERGDAQNEAQNAVEMRDDASARDMQATPNDPPRVEKSTRTRI